MTSVFSINPDQLSELAEQILSLAIKHGASQAQVSIDQTQGLALHVRQGKVQSRVRELQSGFSLTVYNGKQQGSVNSTDMSPASLEESVRAACAIARHTEEDDASGIATPDELCTDPQSLDLFHPWDIDETLALNIAHEIERGIGDAGPGVQSEGAWVNSNQTAFLLATTAGFSNGSAHSSHSYAGSAFGRTEEHSEMAFSVESEPNSLNLPAPYDFGRKIGQRALAYLDQAPLTSRHCRVLFDPKSAASLVGHVVQAISGQALYTQASFLKDRLNQNIMADHLSLLEDPFIRGGKASFSFDGDGIAPTQRTVVDAGQLKGFFLSRYTAHRLEMKPTGNGYGPGNLFFKSDLTAAGDDFEAMLRKLDTGLLVTDLVGNGVRLISGDYSRGARGFWVEGGEIKHAVTGITISDNLNNMLQTIVAVGSDVVSQGGLSTGSILIEKMQVSGV